MRPELERLGRWDPVRVRQRFLTGFYPAHTFVIVVAASAAGVIAVRPESDEQWIEHFYLAPEYQGQGLGSTVLRHVMGTHRDHRPFRLNVLQGSPARRLYERNGFVHEHEDPIEVFLVAESDQDTNGPARALRPRPGSRRPSESRPRREPNRAR